MMFLSLHNRFKQLPQAVRLSIVSAVGAVLVFGICLLVRNLSSVPAEANFLPADCSYYLRVNSHSGPASAVADKVASLEGVSEIVRAADTGVFSVCRREQGDSIIYVQADDKSIEPSIAAAGFIYKKIGKGKYLISRSVEALQEKSSRRLSSRLKGKYHQGDGLLVLVAPAYLSDLALPRLPFACYSGGDCLLYGREQDGYLAMLTDQAKEAARPEPASDNFDMAYSSKAGGVLCGGDSDGKVADLALPLWSQLMGQGDYDDFLCADYLMAVRTNSGSTSTPSIWHGYFIRLQVTLPGGFADGSVLALESQLKKTVAYVFPFTEQVTLNDGTKVQEVRINPDKLVFEERDGHKALDFPDGSGGIYYRISGNSAIISNELSQLYDEASGQPVSHTYLMAKSPWIDPYLASDFAELFSEVIVTAEAAYFK